MMEFDNNMRLGSLLVEQGTITKEQLQSALIVQKSNGRRLGQTLVLLRYATEGEIVEALTQIALINKAKKQEQLKSSDSLTPSTHNSQSDEKTELGKNNYPVLYQAPEPETLALFKPKFIHYVLLSAIFVVLTLGFFTFWAASQYKDKEQTQIAQTPDNHRTQPEVNLINSANKVAQEETEMELVNTQNNNNLEFNDIETDDIAPLDEILISNTETSYDDIDLDFDTSTNTVNDTLELNQTTTIKENSLENREKKKLFISSIRYNIKIDSMRIVFESKQPLKENVFRQYLENRYIEYRFENTELSKQLLTVLRPGRWITTTSFDYIDNDLLWRFQIRKPGTAKYHELEPTEDTPNYRFVIILRSQE